MENNSQSRTLYLIQIITIVILVLLLVMQVLPFFGIMPPGKQPQIQTFPKSHISQPVSSPIGFIHSPLILK